MHISRRAFVTSSFAVASLGGALSLAGCYESESVTNMNDLMEPGPLPEKCLGKVDAPVVVVEYWSLGCPHCAAFNAEVFPHLMSAYIDKGKVRYIARDFPLDQIDAAADMLARSAPEDKYFNMVELFFSTQERWHESQSPVDALFNLVKQAGFTRESFESSLKDQKLLDGITAVRAKAAEKFHVDATPMFFVNGKKSDRFQSISDVDATLSALIGS